MFFGKLLGFTDKYFAIFPPKEVRFEEQSLCLWSQSTFLKEEHESEEGKLIGDDRATLLQQSG